MATVIPDPLRIACTECHRDMSVRFQSFAMHTDSMVVAAECGCGRVFGEIDGALIVAGWGSKGRPIIAHALRHNADLGPHAANQLAKLRERMDHYERMIGAATWASERPREEVG